MTLLEIENLQPDHKGMVEVILDGQNRRFVKEKLIAFLQRNGATTSLETPETPRGKKEPKYDIPGKGVWKRRPVIATLPDGTEVRFISQREAGAKLKINHTNIPKVLAGNHRLKCGIKFRYAEN